LPVGRGANLSPEENAMEKLRALKRFKYDGRHLERGDEFEPREKDKRVLVAARLAEQTAAADAVTIAPPPAQLQTRQLKADEPPPAKAPPAALGDRPRYLRRDMRPKE
jgi:hypothetical protein